MTRRRTAAMILVLATAVPLAACSSDSSDGSAAPTTAAADAPTSPATQAVAEQALADERTAIDVRTPEEYAEGHVDGATLINFQAPDFAERIAALDPEVPYVVYCRSGNRSAQAAAQMEAAGLDVVDGGAFATMADAGWPTA